MTDQTPRTEAGRRLAVDHWDAAVACGMSRVFMEDAILAIEDEAREGCPDEDDVREDAFRQGRAEALDVEVLRGAIYAVSLLHDWAHRTDWTDRTEEIADEYRAILAGETDR